MAEADDARQQVRGPHVAAGQSDLGEQEREPGGGSAIRKIGGEREDGPGPGRHAVQGGDDGERASRRARTTWPVIRLKSRSWAVSMARVAPMMSSTSPPEQKPRPSPARTRARTARSRDSWASRSRRSA